MNRTKLYDIAQSVGEPLAAEQDGARLDAAISSAAEENKVDGADYNVFKQDVLEAKHRYFVLGQQRLQSEINAENAAKKLTQTQIKAA